MSGLDALRARGRLAGRTWRGWPSNLVALAIVCNVAEARAALTSLDLLLDDWIYPDRYDPTPFTVQGAAWIVLEILSVLAVVPFVVWLRAVKSSNRVEPKPSEPSEMTLHELWRAARTARAHRQGTDAPSGRAILATAWWCGHGCRARAGHHRLHRAHHGADTHSVKSCPWQPLRKTRNLEHQSAAAGQLAWQS